MQPEQWSKTYQCPNYPSCGAETEAITYIQSTYCPLCPQTPGPVPNEVPHITRHTLPVYLREKVERLLSLAAQSKQQYKTFPNEFYGRVLVEGEQEHIYDSYNPYEFCGKLTPDQWLFLNSIRFKLTEYILDRETPELTDGQNRLYYQLRIADILYEIDKVESENALKDLKDLGNAELIRRLNKILTPVVPGADDDQNCPICKEAYGSSSIDGEASMQLPCSHVVGHQCIEAWADQWSAGRPLWVCPLCRGEFDLLTPWERAAGIGVPEEEPLAPRTTWWITLFYAVWTGPVTERDPLIYRQERLDELDEQMRARQVSLDEEMSSDRMRLRQMIHNERVRGGWMQALEENLRVINEDHQLPHDEWLRTHHETLRELSEQYEVALAESMRVHEEDMLWLNERLGALESRLQH